MKKRILVLMVGFLFIGINVFAADGDLIVKNCNLTVQGTIQGTIQGIKITHVTGTNPTCPSGTGTIIARKFAPKTCTGYGNCYGSCTTTGTGWGTTDPFTCQYDAPDGSGYCSTFTCYSNWTEVICMGN